MHFSWTAAIIGILLLGIGLTLIFARKSLSKWFNAHRPEYDVDGLRRRGGWSSPWLLLIYGIALGVLGFLFVVGELLALIPQS